jgi:hypothetical protein
MNFSVPLILPAVIGSGDYSASKRNEYKEQKNYVSGELSKAAVVKALCYKPEGRGFDTRFT